MTVRRRIGRRVVSNRFVGEPANRPRPTARARRRVMVARYQRFRGFMSVTHEDQEKRMRITHVWTGIRTAALAAALGAGFASNAGADAMGSASINSFMDYSTSGTVDSTGVTGTPVIGFNSVSSGSYTA